MKKLFLLLSFFSLIFVYVPHSFAQSPCEDTSNPIRCGECDACGYCRGREAPDNWDSCSRCLYEEFRTAVPNAVAEDDNTLMVIGTVGEKARPITPALGKYYTQLGCLDTSMNSFTDPEAAGGLLNFILNRLIFPVSGVLAFLSLIYGAFLLATAQSNPEQIARGRGYIIGAIVGILFVIGVIFIIGFIAGDILKIPFFSTGIKVNINAAGVRNGNERDMIQDPQLAVLVNNEEIGRLTIPGVNGSPSASDYKTYTLSALELDSFDTQKDIIALYYTNDYCQRIYTCGGSGYHANRDIFMKSLTVDGKKCLKFANTADRLDRSPSAYFWWNGTATCIQWS